MHIEIYFTRNTLPEFVSLTSLSPTILWVFNTLPYIAIANSGLIYTSPLNQNKQIITSKDKMKYCQLKDEEINFALLQKWRYKNDVSPSKMMLLYWHNKPMKFFG